LLGLSQTQHLACEDESPPTLTPPTIDKTLIHLLGKQATEAETSDNRWSTPEENIILASQMEYHYLCLASTIWLAWLGWPHQELGSHQYSSLDHEQAIGSV